MENSVFLSLPDHMNTSTKPTYTQILVASSIGLIIAAAMHYRLKKIRDQRIIPRIRFSETSQVLNIEKFSHYVGNESSDPYIWNTKIMHLTHASHVCLGNYDNQTSLAVIKIFISVSLTLYEHVCVLLFGSILGGFHADIHCVFFCVCLWMFNVCEQLGRWGSQTEENAQTFASWHPIISGKPKGAKKKCMRSLRLNRMWIPSSLNWWKSSRDAFSATLHFIGHTLHIC